jgi:hypothetical protein
MRRGWRAVGAPWAAALLWIGAAASASETPETYTSTSIPANAAWAPVAAWVTARPLPHADERAALMQDYLRQHLPPGVVATPEAPRVVVLHWTAGPTAESCWQTFAPARLSGRPELQRGGAVNVGAHFIIERDGRVLQVQPTTTPARHAIGLNHLSIGVENVGDGARYPLTEAQVASNIRLIEALRAAHPSISHLIGHHEALSMKGGPLYAEADPKYINQKADPGDVFMAKVRAGVAPGLRGPTAP